MEVIKPPKTIPCQYPPCQVGMEDVGMEGVGIEVGILNNGQRGKRKPKIMDVLFESPFYSL